MQSEGRFPKEDPGRRPSAAGTPVDGLPHRYRLKSGRKIRTLKTKEVRVPVRPGDVFLIESGGGGGWGNPARRNHKARQADGDDGFVTRQKPK